MGRKLVRFGVERVREEGWTWSRHYCWASGAWPWATPQENQLHKQGSSEHVCTHTLFKSLPHIFLIHNTPRQTLLLKGKKLLCAELQVVRITAWLMWKDEQHMISTKVFRIKSGPTKVWVDLKKKHTGHDLTYWKYNLRPIITPKSFLTHIHRLSSKKKKAHTPDHTIARYNHCSVCKQCCPGTAVSGSYSVRILQSFVFYFQSMRGLIRERARLNVVIEHAQREQKHEGRNGRGDFCSVDCDLPHLEHIRGQSGSTNEEKSVIRHSRWRRQHKQYRWYW